MQTHTQITHIIKHTKKKTVKKLKPKFQYFFSVLLKGLSSTKPLYIHLTPLLENMVQINNYYLNFIGNSAIHIPLIKDKSSSILVKSSFWPKKAWKNTHKLMSGGEYLTTQPSKNRPCIQPEYLRFPRILYTFSP